jgi:cation transport regulator
MPYSSNAELPEGVRNALPPRAQRVFREAFNGAMKRGLSEKRAFQSAWGAIKNAGWHRNADGKWVKKAGPSSSDVHVDRPMGGRKNPKHPMTDDDDEDQEHEADEEKAGKAAPAETAEGLKATSFAVEVKKLDEDRNLVFGWLSVIEENGEAVVDLQGHVIEESTMEDAAYDMVINGCDAGEMHERIGIGLGLIECMAFTKAKQEVLGIDLGKVGLWLGFKVDDEAFAKVKSGELRAFSLGGSGFELDMEEAA